MEVALTSTNEYLELLDRRAFFVLQSIRDVYLIFHREEVGHFCVLEQLADIL